MRKAGLKIEHMKLLTYLLNYSEYYLGDQYCIFVFINLFLDGASFSAPRASKAVARVYCNYPNGT